MCVLRLMKLSLLVFFSTNLLYNVRPDRLAVIDTPFSQPVQVIARSLHLQNKTCWLQAPGKQKLKTREDLSEKEIANVGVSTVMRPRSIQVFGNSIEHSLFLLQTTDFQHDSTARRSAVHLLLRFFSDHTLQRWSVTVTYSHYMEPLNVEYRMRH